MSSTTSAPNMAPRDTVPPLLRSACLLLVVFNFAMIPAMYFDHAWLFDTNGRFIHTDFLNIWAAGKLALDGQPALAWNWDIHKQVQVAMLGQSYVGDYAWHYPPPFLFVAMFLAHFSYATGLVGWAAASFVPYMAMMRAVVGQRFGLMVGAAFPVVLANTMAGQNGFLTAALLGGTLVLMPTRPILSGICLGLLSYKPQYGVLFPLVLIAASQWTVFFGAAVTTAALALMSWIAFGTDSWQAFFHWMPMFSQAFFTEGRATFFKLQSVFGLVRTMGGSEQVAWMFQWIISGTVLVCVIMLWRSRADYVLKAAALAAGTLLLTPYLFLYDLMVLAIPVGLLLRIGLADGFRRGELTALACAMGLLIAFPFFEMPLGLGSTLIVAALIARRVVNAFAEERVLPREIAAAG
ncbi:glycosyltransferase family 87 protein [Bradyrhizobium sp.]|uniref:glycosyltransferase family 87 protein n=1 Tax=Bradyrhizobium sp. TaxID=376 RepID=UPI003C73E1CC